MSKEREYRTPQDFEDVREARAKLLALREEQKAITHRLMHLKERRERGDHTAERATALLAGDEAGAAPRPDEVEVLEDRTNVLRVALVQQEKRLQAVTALAHAEIAADAYPELQEIAARIAKTATAFGEAVDAEAIFFRRLGRAGRPLADVRLTWPACLLNESRSLGRARSLPTLLSKFIRRAEIIARTQRKTRKV